MAFHAALAIALMSVSAAERAPLQPTGAWVVAFEENLCLLQRSYGTALALAFRQLPTSLSTGVYLFERAAVRSSPNNMVTISFGPGTPSVESLLNSYYSREKRRRTFEAHLKRTDLKQAEVSRQLQLDAGADFKHKFAVPGLRQALAKLDECAADLLVHWGLPRDQLARTAQFPQALGQIVKPHDLPEDALILGISGNTTARVRVNALGVSSNCEIVNSSGLQSIDEATCYALLRAKYKPALDHDGRSIDSIYANSIHWRVMDR